jgi:hypothetical protein
VRAVTATAANTLARIRAGQIRSGQIRSGHMLKLMAKVYRATVVARL